MNEPKVICPVCEQGTLSFERYAEEIEHAGQKLAVGDLERTRCNTCGADPVLTDQIRRNQLRVCDAKRRSSGYMIGSEIRELRERLLLSQPEAAQLFGGGANAFSKYERGEIIQSLPMDRLLTVAAAFPWIVEFLRCHVGMEPGDSGSTEYTDAGAVSLSDTSYRSRSLVGDSIVATPEKKESSVIHLRNWAKAA